MVIFDFMESYFSRGASQLASISVYQRSTWALDHSSVRLCGRSLVAQIFRRRANFGGAKISEKTNLGRRDRFRQKNVKIRAILAIFRPFQNFEGRHASSEVRIWRSCEFLSLTMTFVSKNHPRCPKIQLSMIFGGGVKSQLMIFFLTFGPKLTCTFWFTDMMV